jgi:hypothetical protein
MLLGGVLTVGGGAEGRQALVGLPGGTARQAPHDLRLDVDLLGPVGDLPFGGGIPE